MTGRTGQKEREPRKARPRAGCLLYKVLITCKGLFVIAEFKNLLPYINKRPECPKSLAWSVFKMCLHVGDSDPSWRAVSLWNGRGGPLNLPVSHTGCSDNGQKAPLGLRETLKSRKVLDRERGVAVGERMRIYDGDLWGVSYRSLKLIFNA